MFWWKGGIWFEGKIGVYATSFRTHEFDKVPCTRIIISHDWTLALWIATIMPDMLVFPTLFPLPCPSSPSFPFPPHHVENQTTLQAQSIGNATPFIAFELSLARKRIAFATSEAEMGRADSASVGMWRSITGLFKGFGQPKVKFRMERWDMYVCIYFACIIVWVGLRLARGLKSNGEGEIRCGL